MAARWSPTCPRSRCSSRVSSTRRRFLDIVRNFVVFSDEPDGLGQAGRQVPPVLGGQRGGRVDRRSSGPGRRPPRRCGLAHPGSGKSFEMVFYAAKIMRDPRMSNPTLVFITDRNDLDDQLFGEVFAPAEILPESPVQADTRADLRTLLQPRLGRDHLHDAAEVRAGEAGDANPVLTDRRNVVVVADEAHRSQYGFSETLERRGHARVGARKAHARRSAGRDVPRLHRHADRVDRQVDPGSLRRLHRHLRPHARRRGWRNSQDLLRVAAGQGQLCPRRLRGARRNWPTRSPSRSRRTTARKAKSRWARLEAIVGAEDRLDLIAADIVEHWEKRREALFGKAMIVAMSRRIAVRLYEKIVALRPDWHDDDPKQGKIKVVMTGSAADPPEFQPHIHSKDVRKDLKARAKNPDDPLELVIVRDMWLTGFDAPSMHTMYVDKTMQGAGLMQAIARVNRTFRDKPGGLIVDYIGVFANLQKALAEYSPTDRDQAGVPIEEMVAVMLEKHDIVRRAAARLRLRLVTGPAARPAARPARQGARLRDGRPRPHRALPRPSARPRQGLRPLRLPATRRSPSATTPGCSPTFAPRSSRSRTRTPGVAARVQSRSIPPSGSSSTRP